MSCGVGRRRGLDPALLWLWRRLVATAPIRPLGWEPPYAAGAAQEIAKKKDLEKKLMSKEFPGGPVAEIWGFHFCSQAAEDPPSSCSMAGAPPKKSPRITKAIF